MADWIVKLVDDQGAAITDATVSLVREADVQTTKRDAEVVPTSNAAGPLPTMTHATDGLYRLPKPLVDPKGDWRLVVRSRVGSVARGVVIQPLRIEPSKLGGFTTTPRNLDPKGVAAEVATVEIKTTHAAGDSTTTLWVRQPPASEVVLMSGTQYEHSGEPLRTFCEGRRDALARAKVPAERRIDDGTIVTMFSLDDRATLWFAKARTKAIGWVLVHRVDAPGTPGAPITPGAPWPSKPNAGSRSVALHPTDLYRYLHVIGRDVAHRGRVREVSIFSHAYREGPILYNTDDDTATPGPRDANDFDCRTKDWEDPELGSYRAASLALAPTGRWHIWGCNSNSRIVAMCAAANLSRSRKAPDTELFEVKLSGQRGRFEAKLSRRRVLEIHLECLTSRDSNEQRTYGSMLVGAFQRDVFSALPGTWSSFGPATRTMYVDPDPKSWPIVEQYYKGEPALAPKFVAGTGLDGERYVNYRAFAAVPRPSIPATSAQYEVTSWEKDGVWRFVARFHGRHWIEGKFDPKCIVDALADVGRIAPAHAGKSGHRYVFEAPNTNDSLAALVVEVGNAVKVYRLLQGAGGEFDRLGAEVLPR